MIELKHSTSQDSRLNSRKMAGLKWPACLQETPLLITLFFLLGHQDVKVHVVSNFAAYIQLEANNLKT